MKAPTKPDYRSEATRAAWKTLRGLHKQIKEADERIEDCLDDVDADLDDEELLRIRRDKKRFVKQFDDIVTRCEQKELRKLADAIMQHCVPHLRYMIYEYLCCEDGPILIPNRGHAFFHEHYGPAEVSYIASGESLRPREYEDEEEDIRYELDALRRQPIFDPKWVGVDMAKETTNLWLEKNEFHFRDARRLMCDFLTTPFACGSVPKDHLSNITIFVRCEDFLEWAGWDGAGDDEGEVPEEDFKWREKGVYHSKIRKELPTWSLIPFKRQPKVTFVIVTPFGRWGAETIDVPRIMLNFEEAILSSYEYFKRKGSAVTVVTKPIGACESLLKWTEDEDVTWQLELAAELYLRGQPSHVRAITHFVYPNRGSKKTPQRLQLEKRVNEVMAPLIKRKEAEFRKLLEEEEAEFERSLNRRFRS
ncbi:uncharacterized protein K460DRAFT_364727 [Cucurbitaria berberidis CBS 394.84]|uniref:Uncharacterized protein n=1 Tax=Cucurbitaria berberidis CBS 394.84 TaxID=1168544 RepID=A0A9P4GP38_9PLEO|nr:uncharacterized protein K460DRAFT_364727 [Cucurbitaria berberidis CBS 394.84]KAF1848754.1 hypothetical protein K460DRAFT_364727 [Cucurbitaria berberidis CBS 394.84]